MDSPSSPPWPSNHSLGANASAGYAIAAIAIAAVAINLLTLNGWAGWFGTGLAVVAATIAVIDHRSFRIPDWLSASGFALGLAWAAFQAPDSSLAAVAIACLRGGVVAFTFFTLRYAYKRVRGREGLGLGDVKLAGVAGAWLDWLYIPIAIELAVFSAISVCLIQYVATGRTLAPTLRLPFGAFLAPAIWLSWFLQQSLSF